MNLSFLGEFDRIYTYRRVSSANDAQQHSIETQGARLDAIVPKPDRHYEDIQSGDDLDRPGYQQLLLDVQEDALIKRLHVLIVITEQSRLSRNENLPQVIELLDTIGVTLYALDGGRKTAVEPQDWLQVNQEAIFNQYFLRQLRRTLRSAKAQKRSEGKPLNPRPPWGWLWSRERYLVDETKREIMLEFFRNYLPPTSGGRGWSLLRCAKYAATRGVKITPHGMRCWLVNPIHCGHLYGHPGGYSREDRKRDREIKLKGGTPPVRQQQILRYGAHEALITQEMHDAILARLKENRQYARRGAGENEVRYALSGIVFCQQCERKMTRQTTVEKTTGKRYGNYQCINLECSNNRSISARKLEAKLTEAIALRAEQLAKMFEEGKERKRESPTVSPEETRLKAQLQSLRSIYSQNPIDGVKIAIAELEGKLAALHRQDSTASFVRSSLNESIQLFADPKRFDGLSEAERRLVFHELCDRILVPRHGEVSVRLRL